MAKDLSFSTFLDEYDTDFFDYLSKTSTACHSETRYKELTEKIKTLYEQYPNVRKVLDVDRQDLFQQYSISGIFCQELFLQQSGIMSLWHLKKKRKMRRA